MKRILVLLLILIVIKLPAQTDRAFIRLASPGKDNNAVRGPKQFISGATCKDCSLTVNGLPVKVYPTGGFAAEPDLKPGTNVVTIVATSGKSETTRRLTYNFSLPVQDTVKILSIASIETFPEGDLVVSPGDKIKFRVKALPGCTVVANTNIALYEMPVNEVNPVPGIYQGEYDIKETDSFLVARIPVMVTDRTGKSFTKKAESKISMLALVTPNTVVTKGRLAHLLFGLGDDRLVGAKIGYIDSMIPLRIIGKVGSLYRVRLSKYRTAYIPDEEVEPLPKGTFAPESLTANWQVYGDSLFDYVQLGLFARLPYQSFQSIDPSKIVVDVFGATNNSNWIIQMGNDWYGNRANKPN